MKYQQFIHLPDKVLRLKVRKTFSIGVIPVIKQRDDIDYNT